MDYLDKPDLQTFIAHYGIKGQKWGVRRFQNADGSLTKAGKERYNLFLISRPIRYMRRLISFLKLPTCSTDLVPLHHADLMIRT